MAPGDAALTQTLGAGGAHILFVDFFQKRVFGEQGGKGKTAQHRCTHRQSDMPKIIFDLAPGRQIRKIGRSQAAQRKPLHLPRQKHQKQHTHDKTRYGHADQNQNGGAGIKTAARTQGFGYA